jgi:hypothetical protein
MLVAAAALMAVAQPSVDRTVWLTAASRWLAAPAGTVWLSVPKSAAPGTAPAAATSVLAGASMGGAALSVPFTATVVTETLTAVKPSTEAIPALAIAAAPQPVATAVVAAAPVAQATPTPVPAQETAARETVAGSTRRSPAVKVAERHPTPGVPAAARASQRATHADKHEGSA